MNRRELFISAGVLAVAPVGAEAAPVANIVIDGDYRVFYDQQGYAHHFSSGPTSLGTRWPDGVSWHNWIKHEPTV